jgi:hypothetical protein
MSLDTLWDNTFPSRGDHNPAYQPDKDGEGSERIHSDAKHGVEAPGASAAEADGNYTCQEHQLELKSVLSAIQAITVLSRRFR